jgi:hypothetical protein
MVNDPTWGKISRQHHARNYSAYSCVMRAFFDFIFQAGIAPTPQFAASSREVHT